MTLQRAFPSDWDVKILATDLDSNVLAKAQSGIYTAANVNGLDDALLKRWFLTSKDGQSYKAKTQKGSPITLEALEIGAVDFIAKPTVNVKEQMSQYADIV